MDDGTVLAITSLKWPNGNEVPLSWHQARLLTSAAALGWDKAVVVLSEPSAIVQIERALENHLITDCIDRTQAHKVTLHIASNGHITVSSSELSGPLHAFRLQQVAPGDDDEVSAVNVYLSPHAIQASVFTTHKTSMRSNYNQAREAVTISDLPPTTAEVLLYNDQGEITEGSLSTVYFQRGMVWITPHAGSGCNLGLTRALALEKNWCQQGRILKSELRHGETIMLSNCVRGFWPGRVVLHRKDPAVTASAAGL